MRSPLRTAPGKLFDQFSPTERRQYERHAGYGGTECLPPPAMICRMQPSRHQNTELRPRKRIASAYHRQMKNYPHLLRLVSLVKRSFPKHRRFNVFDSLREPHDEVRLHSRFIAALIDPDHHKLAPDALHALLRILEIPLPGQAAFSLSNARVRTEEKSIDILVTNDKQQALIIENKIHANDQDKQLRRYYQAMLGERYTDIYVVYLTIDGHEASEASLDGLSTELGPRLQNISYDYHIRTWLSEVERIAVREPYLRESVNQYAAVIDRLTGNDLPEEYMDELVAILLTNDHMKSARDIRTAYTQALIALQERVWIGLLEDFQANFPDMMAYLTDDSLSQDAVERKGIIQKFYQPSAHKRNYYGIYFGTPGYEHIAVGIEIENGLYTGAYCPPTVCGGIQSRERRDSKIRINRTSESELATLAGMRTLG